MRSSTRRSSTGGIWGPAPIALTSLSPGSYLLTVRLDGHSTVRFPFLAGRSEKLSFTIVLPKSTEVPEAYGSANGSNI
jgi:hypothetical protein